MFVFISLYISNEKCRTIDQKCNGPITNGMVRGQGQLEIRCDPGYELKNPDEKYKCNKKKIKGKKARVVEPEPKCVRKCIHFHVHDQQQNVFIELNF